MKTLCRIADWLSPGDPNRHREAAERTERISAHLDAQEPEVQRLAAFARWQLAENHIAPKIQRAIREGR